MAPGPQRLPRGRTQDVPSTRQGHSALLSRLDPEPHPCSTSVSKTATCARHALPKSRSRSTGWLSTPSPGLRPPHLTCACEHLHLLRLSQPHSHPLQHTGDVITGPVQAVVLHVPTHTPIVREGQPELTCAGPCPALAKTPPTVPTLGRPWPGALRPASLQEPHGCNIHPIPKQARGLEPWVSMANHQRQPHEVRSTRVTSTLSSGEGRGVPGVFGSLRTSRQRPPLLRTAQWPP